MTSPLWWRHLLICLLRAQWEITSAVDLLLEPLVSSTRSRCRTVLRYLLVGLLPFQSLNLDFKILTFCLNVVTPSWRITYLNLFNYLSPAGPVLVISVAVKSLLRIKLTVNFVQIVKLPLVQCSIKFCYQWCLILAQSANRLNTGCPGLALEISRKSKFDSVNLLWPDALACKKLFTVPLCELNCIHVFLKYPVDFTWKSLIFRNAECFTLKSWKLWSYRLQSQ